jgi:hypothetical protein
MRREDPVGIDCECLGRSFDIAVMFRGRSYERRLEREESGVDS